MKTTTSPATCLSDRTPFTAREVRWINQVLAFVARRGAASTEMVARELKLDWMVASWALWHSGAKFTPAELWVL